MSWWSVTEPQETAPPQKLPGIPDKPGFLESLHAGDAAADLVRLGGRQDHLVSALDSRQRQIERATGQRLPTSTTLSQLDLAGDTSDAGDLLGRRPTPQIGPSVSDEDYERQIEDLRRRFPQQMQGVETGQALRERVGRELNDLGVNQAQAFQAHPVAAMAGQLWGMATRDPLNVIAGFATGGAAEAPLITRMGLQAIAQDAIIGAQAPARAVEAAQVGGPAYGGKEIAGDLVAGGLFGAGFEAVGAGMGAALRRAVPAQLSANDTLRGVAQQADALDHDLAAVGEDRAGGEVQAGLAALRRGDMAPPRVEQDAELADLFPAGEGAASYKGRAITAASFDPATLRTDAARFQYKADADAAGVTARLKGVEAWDPLAAGRVIVWEDAAGTRFVADGHQRFGLMQRLNDDRGFEHRLDGFLLRERDGWTAQEVRATAALKNLREGSGTPLDAAKVLRDVPDALRDRSLPAAGEFMAQARGLAQLDPEAFSAVVNGVIPERYAAEIGQLAPGQSQLHMDLVRLLKAGDPANADEARALVVEGLQEDWLKTQGEQDDLFGHDPSVSAMIGRAKVAAAVKRALSRDARLFNGLVRHADAIEAGGNLLSRDANEARLATDRVALGVTAKLAMRSGPVGEAMAAAAKAVTAGENPSKAAGPVLARVRELIEAGEDLHAARGVSLDPPPPSPAAQALLEEFDDPFGAGAKGEAQAKPEDAELEGGDLFADLAPVDSYDKAHKALMPCAPGML